MAIVQSSSSKNSYFLAILLAFIMMGLSMLSSYINIIMEGRTYVVKYGLLLVVSVIPSFILIVVENVELDLFLGFLHFNDGLLLLIGGLAAETWHQRVRFLKKRVKRLLEVRVCLRIFFLSSNWWLRDGRLYWRS